VWVCVRETVEERKRESAHSDRWMATSSDATVWLCVCVGVCERERVGETNTERERARAQIHS